MKRPLGVAVLLAALAAFAVAVAAADTGGTDRPFKGKVLGSATVAPDANCPIGLRTVSEGSGTGSHLGLVSMSSHHCTPVANAIAGQMTLVAANGDELHLTYSGTCSAPPFPPVGETLTCITDNVVVGGTARFADATGEVQVTALVTWTGFGAPLLPATWTWDGTLSY